MESQLGRALWAYLTPVIVLTGLVGNVLTLITVLNKHSKKTSFTVILAALAIYSAYIFSISGVYLSIMVKECV